jgi:DNA-binding NtrC family response regulator
MLVQEDASLSKSLETSLRRGGWNVLTARSALEARVAAANVRFQVLVTVVALPDGSGRALADELMAEHPGATVFMTAAGDRQREARTVAERPGVLLPRPFADDQLLDAVATAFMRRASERRVRGR